MTIPALGALSAIGVPPVGGLIDTIGPVDPLAGGGPGPAGGSSSGVDFAAQLGKGLEWLQGIQTNSDNLAVQAATGSLTDVHDYMIASAEASLATELTVAVRNKAVEAFSEIMRMQA